MRLCSRPGCPTIYPSSEGSRCTECRRKASNARGDRGYGTAGHKRFRRAVLARDPICVICNLAFSSVADHHPKTRKQLIDEGLNPNDPQYGRGLCKPDHDRHTAATTPGGWNAR